MNLALTPDDLLPSILRHMSHALGFRLTEIIRLVTANVPHSATATYHLLQARLDVHNHPAPAPATVRPLSRALSLVRTMPYVNSVSV